MKQRILFPGVAILLLLFFLYQPAEKPVQEALNMQAAKEEQGDAPAGRWEYELKRLADPSTGKMPERMHARELEYAATLPTDFDQKKSTEGLIFTL